MKALSDAGVPVAIAGKVSILDRPETRLIAHILVWWAGGSWRPGEAEEQVNEELLISEICEVTGKSRDAAWDAVCVLKDLGERLRKNGVRDIIETYMAVLSILGLPSAKDQVRQEKSLGAMSSLLVSFENSVKRSVPEGVLKWGSLPPTIPGAAEESSEDEVISGVRDEATKIPDTSGTSLKFQRGEVYLLGLRGFLERFSSEAVEISSEGVEVLPNAVNILTIHQSKGLEFPVVFVPCLVEGRFPSSRTGRKRKWYLPESMTWSSSPEPDRLDTKDPGQDETRECAGQTGGARNSGGQPFAGGRNGGCPRQRVLDIDRYEGRMADERRLFYVAVTRARDLLILSTFRDYGKDERGAKPAPVSRFLNDVASNPLLARELKKLGQGVAPRGRRSANRGTLTVDCGQLLVYSECPRRYYLRYECGFAPPIASALGFGKLAHHVVTEAVRRAWAGTPITPDEIARILRDRFYLPFASSDQKTIMFQALLRRLRAYAESRGKDLARAIEVELPFEVPVDGFRVRGRIDLVLAAVGSDVPSDGSLRAQLSPPSTCAHSGATAEATAVEIVDLKTSENRPPLPRHKNQLRLYGKALGLLGKNPVRLTIHDLDSEDGHVIEVEPNDTEFGEFEAEMARWLWGIRNSRFEPVFGPACKACDYAGLCSGSWRDD